MDRLLSLLQNNARLTNKQLAVMLGREEEDVAKAIAAYEKSGVIRGYQAVIDWDKTDSPTVFARIEIKVTPKKDFGFEEIARTIMELEGEEGFQHLEEYSDSTTERGKQLRKTICDKFQFASLEFQSLEGVIKSIGLPACKLCTYCWNGKG